MPTKTKCIYLVGPSSTGKTTLCNALAAKLTLPKSCIVSEVAREVLRTQGFTRKDIGLLEMQRAIMEAHLKRESEASEENDILLCDRSAIDPIAYAVLTTKDESHAKERMSILTSSGEFQMALERYRSSLFILLLPVEEWLEDDGIRSLEDQDRCAEVFKRVLGELGIEYKELGPNLKDLARRVDFVLNEISILEELK
ncbi:hypothetical protein K435DRAFT_731257 [Dendrothele bispora CBS 962.96]|uniref:NadR/Ttd14 AAA domain-containing protein n=1 Tax=Dendrothele bispora (strain CBS 962.96) TaxID=1314807 RepID=A0A4S8LD54_DENBC|nr:hypothetical protein K435DRAFT_731257 [Dendrothele bispora CBS 962.96]